MSNKKLRTLGLEANLLHRLHRNNINTCKDVLSKTVIELVYMLNVSIFVVDSLVNKVCETCAPLPIRAFDIWEARKRKDNLAFIPTSLTELDLVLKGGLHIGTVTEIAGPAGCGKTQFCLMMSIMSVLNTGHVDLSGGVIYIDTESTFSSQRLVEMAVTRFPDTFSSEDAQHDLLSRVCVCPEHRCDSLLLRLQNLEEEVIVRGARLVILDSVASLVRKDFDTSVQHNLAERSKMLSKIAAVLKQTAETLSIPVVVTNQITTHFVNHQTHVPEIQRDEDIIDIGNKIDNAVVTIALGNTWSHCVNTRLIVQYIRDIHRQLLVAKSPIAPFTSFMYRIDESGLVLEEGGCDYYQGTDPGLQSIRVRSITKNSAFCME